MRLAGRALLLAIALAGCAGQRADLPSQPQRGQSTAVVVVRHAERAEDGTSDPPLSEAGLARARSLAGALAGADLAAVYTTQYRRTRQTGEALGVEVTVRPVTAENAAGYAGSVAAEIRERFPGRTVVVVGHSNTVPQIVDALGGGSVPVIPEDEYERLYVVLLDEAGSRLITGRMP